MHITVMVRVVDNDGREMLHAAAEESSPGLSLDPRENIVEAAARTFEMMAEVKERAERQIEEWTDPAVTWNQQTGMLGRAPRDRPGE